MIRTAVPEVAMLASAFALVVAIVALPLWG
jgi:hypothetical protein